MKYLLILTLFFSGSSLGEGFHYCTGKVIDIVTRASDEGTKIRIEGMDGWAALGYGGESQKEMHDRQFSMLLSAYMAGTKVTLEFLDNTKTCSDDHHNVQFRYVRLRP